MRAAFLAAFLAGFFAAFFAAFFFGAFFFVAFLAALRAGFWAGIFSSIFYWIAMSLGLLIKALPLVQRIVNESGATPGEALRRAISRVAPPIIRANIFDFSNQGLRSMLILVAIGLACAMGCALLGGLLGSRYANRN